MVEGAKGQSQLPRIVPTLCHIRALQGAWQLDGRVIHLFQEPGTGVLLAVDLEGRNVNPLRAISQGYKMGEPPVGAGSFPH